MCCWLFFKRMSFTNASLLQVMVWHYAIRGTFSRLSLENARAPGLTFSTIEIVDCIEYIIVASLSSTQCKMSCGVCGGCDKSNVFNTITIVWCIHLHTALDCGFLLFVGTSLIPSTWTSQAKVYPINLPLISWTTWASLWYQVHHVFSSTPISLFLQLLILFKIM